MIKVEMFGLFGTRGREQASKGVAANFDMLKANLNKNGKDLQVITYQSASSFSGEMYIRLSTSESDKTVYPLHKDNDFVAPYGWYFVDRSNYGIRNNSSGVHYPLFNVTLFKVVNMGAQQGGSRRKNRKTRSKTHRKLRKSTKRR